MLGVTAILGAMVAGSLGGPVRAPHPTRSELPHPLHTSLAELVYDAPSRSVTVTIRVFTEDLAAAVSRRAGAPRAPSDPPAAVPEALAADYLSATFKLADRTGSRLSLQLVASRRTGDVSWLTLRAAIPQGLAGARLSDAIHCELFADQINIVRVTHDGQTDDLLFIRGDGWKTLR